MNKLATLCMTILLASTALSAESNSRRKIVAKGVSMRGDQFALRSESQNFRAEGGKPTPWQKVTTLKQSTTKTFGIRDGQRLTHTLTRDVDGQFASVVEVRANGGINAHGDVQASWTVPGVVTKTWVSGERVFATAVEANGSATMYKFDQTTTKRQVAGPSAKRAAAAKAEADTRLNQ